MLGVQLVGAEIQQTELTRARMESIIAKMKATIPLKLQVLPFPAIRVIGLLITVNLAVWILASIILHFNPLLVTPAILSYTLGLRHALDADHIAAIDLMTRRLVASGQTPVTVGTWFSLGHSTIVVITCIVVAATAGALESKFGGFEMVGGVVGSAVSATVLLVLGIGNAWVLYTLINRLRTILRAQREGEDIALADATPIGLGFEGAGFLTRVFKKVFAYIDKPWKMYPLGVLFGLGFDTSSEVAVLGIASLQGAAGTSLWLILIFPALFTAGMCMLDTTDGALMMTLYTTTSLARDTVAILYYSIVLTGITVLVAICIGTIQLLTLIANVWEPEGSFWDGLDVVSDHYDIIGGSICGSFIVFGLLSVVLYKPWRRCVDGRSFERIEREDDNDEEAAEPLLDGPK